LRPIRVLHAPAAVGGHAPELARAERRRGLDSVSVVLEPTTQGYVVDEVLAPEGSSRLRRELARGRLLVRAFREFDVVHLNFGSPLTPRRYPASVLETRGPSARLFELYAGAVEFRELALLKHAGKAIVVTYQGDDARQALSAPQLPPGYYDPELDERKREWIRHVDRYADVIYALNPDLLRVLPARAEFLPYASVDLRAWTPESAPPAVIPVVVHAPSDRRSKGTDAVLAASAELERRGVAHELVLVEGVTREEARQAYARADLLVDQVVIGWYGGLAVELMALAKPVVAHLNADDLNALPKTMRRELPVVDTDAQSLADVLQELLTTRRHELPEIGRLSRSYVEKWHDPDVVAAHTEAAYREVLRR
jgi:hypothetical protein